MSKKNQKTTTYSLDWETVVNLESRLLRDLQLKKTTSAARNLLMVSIGTRLGLRVIDNLGVNTSKTDPLPPAQCDPPKKSFNCWVN